MEMSPGLILAPRNGGAEGGAGEGPPSPRLRILSWSKNQRPRRESDSINRVHPQRRAQDDYTPSNPVITFFLLAQESNPRSDDGPAT
jgi:hypothetical protein